MNQPRKEVCIQCGAVSEVYGPDIGNKLCCECEWEEDKKAGMKSTTIRSKIRIPKGHTKGVYKNIK